MIKLEKDNARVVFVHFHDYLFPIPRVHIMAEGLNKLGYDVNVIYISDRKSFKENIRGVTIWNAAFSIGNMSNVDSKKNISFFLKLRKNIAKILFYLNPSLVQVFSPLLIPLVVKLKSEIKFKLVYDCYEPWIHGPLASRKYHTSILCYAIHKLYVKYLDAVIFVYMGNPIVNYIPKSCPTVWIPNYMKQEYIPESKTEYLREKLFSENDFIIGYLGVITKFKGYETAIRSLKHLDKNYKLLIVGDAFDMQLKKKLQDIIKEIEIQDDKRIHFTGHISSFREAMEFASIIDVGLMLAENTYWQRYTLPAKLFDYMCLGVPIIASDLPNFRNFFNNYNCGCLVPPGDVERLSNSIIYLNKNSILRQKLSATNKQNFLNNFSEIKQLNKLKILYNDLLQRQ